MTLPWRLWVFMWLLIAGLATAFGLHPAFSGVPWPAAGLLAGVCFACFGLSVFVGAGLVILGLLMDFATDSPIGAWPVAFLAAYAVALIVWDRQPPLSPLLAELIALPAALIAAGLGLVIAGNIAGETLIDRSGVFGDLMVTALAYPAVRFILIPASVREARR